MSTNNSHSEAAVLEQDRIALNNVETQPQIATIMAEYDYGADTVAEGKAILAETEKAYNTNKTEDDETSATYARFRAIKDELDKQYTKDRKKAKVVFRKDPVTAEKLGITTKKPRTYIKWLEAVGKFYAKALADSSIQDKIARLKITPEYITETVNKIGELKTARADYLREVGESQDATKAKDKAFAKLDDWMIEFYQVAEIALEDHPQLLESLGKLVRS